MLLRFESISSCDELISNQSDLDELPLRKVVKESLIQNGEKATLSEHNETEVFQSACRPQDSVETASVRVHNDIIPALDSG